MKNLVADLFNPNNDFFLLTKDAKRLTHISLSSFILPIIFLAIAGALTQIVLAPLIIGSVGEVPSWLRQVFGLYVMFGVAIAVIFLWVRFFEGRSISSLGFTSNNAIKRYLYGFALGLLMNSIVIGIMALFGNINVAEDSSSLTGINALGIVIIFLFGFVVQGAGEEILSRGWMMQVIGAKYKPWLGFLISSLFFAVLHLGNTGVNIASVVNLILFAFFMAFLVLNDGSLWSACAWHSAWNWSLGNFYGLSVSGHGEKTTIFDLNTVGNELLSGGGFGPEASLITTVVLLIGILILAVKLKKKKYVEVITTEDSLEVT